MKKTVFLYINFFVILLAVVNSAQAQDEQNYYQEQLRKVIIEQPMARSGVFHFLSTVGWNRLGPQFIPIVGFRDPNAVPFLINVLQKGPDWSDDEFPRRFTRERADTCRYVARCYAALCLGYIGDSRAFDPLLAVLNNKNIETYPQRPWRSQSDQYNLRAYAAFALGHLGDRRAAEPLIKSLREDGFVDCIYALLRLHDFRTIRPIIEYASWYTQPNYGPSIHRCLENFTGARFHIKYSSESRKCTVPDFPELGELETDKVFGTLWEHWLKEGDRLARQRFEEYNTNKRLLMEKKLEEANKFYKNGSPRSKLSRCGIAALPYIMDAIEKGDIYLIPIVPELTRGHKAKAFHLRPGLSENATRDEALQWWEKNKQQWIIFQPKTSHKPTIAGSIVAWGDDLYGQATPPEGNDFIAIDAGDGHSVALKSDGSIVVWGNNYYNQSYMPPDSNDFVAIAAGGRHGPKLVLEGHSLALKSDGSIVCWGIPIERPPDGNDFVAIAAGGGHSLALKSDGSIVGWGYNYYGQATPPDGNDFVAISAGAAHSLALKSDGSIVGCGLNYNGEATPPDGNDFVAIAAGRRYSLALKSDGSIVNWGYNYNGENTPPDGNDYVAIATGGWQSLALKTNGSIVSWPERPHYPTPAGNDFIAIAVGLNHSLAIKKDCQHELKGDLNNDCKVDFTDFALMASNWLIDCNLNPEDPACVPKKIGSDIFL